ncbi:hypothetical protein M5689_006559 [Euphorbia peplus]|nr:hypothetical protein M5689_006559 [Euphorbia peplus]
MRLSGAGIGAFVSVVRVFYHFVMSGSLSVSSSASSSLFFGVTHFVPLDVPPSLFTEYPNPPLPLLASQGMLKVGGPCWFTPRPIPGMKRIFFSEFATDTGISSSYIMAAWNPPRGGKSEVIMATMRSS